MEIRKYERVNILDFEREHGLKLVVSEHNNFDEHNTDMKWSAVLLGPDGAEVATDVFSCVGTRPRGMGKTVDEAVNSLIRQVQKSTVTARRRAPGKVLKRAVKIDVPELFFDGDGGDRPTMTLDVVAYSLRRNAMGLGDAPVMVPNWSGGEWFRRSDIDDAMARATWRKVLVGRAQRQDSVTDQLLELREVAVRLGMYGAADAIEGTLLNTAAKRRRRKT